MSALKNIVKSTVRKSGFSIRRLRPSAQGNYDDLYSFFSANSNESEIFMKYVYSLLVKEGDWVIDVGANHGIHTGPLSRLAGSQGKVVAFEAVAAHASDIQQSSTIDNIELINKAVTSPKVVKSTKEIQFTYYPKQDGYSGIKARAHVNDIGQKITVATTTIDQELSHHKNKNANRVSFIKVDVEGGDFDALLGAKDILTKHKPVVVFENGMQFAADIYGYTKQQFFAYFEELGYHLFQFTGQPFTESDWGKKGIYWEVWLVHKDSEHLNFFINHYKNLAQMFIEDKVISQ